MRELAGQAPCVRSRAKPYALSRDRITLGAYYERKRARYSVGLFRRVRPRSEALVQRGRGPRRPARGGSGVSAAAPP